LRLAGDDRRSTVSALLGGRAAVELQSAALFLRLCRMTLVTILGEQRADLALEELAVGSGKGRAFRCFRSRRRHHPANDHGKKNKAPLHSSSPLHGGPRAAVPSTVTDDGGEEQGFLWAAERFPEVPFSPTSAQGNFINLRGGAFGARNFVASL